MGSGRGGTKTGRSSSGRKALFGWIPAALPLLSSASLHASTAGGATQSGSWSSLPIPSLILGAAAILLAGAAIGFGLQERVSRKRKPAPENEDLVSATGAEEISLHTLDWRNLWAEHGQDALYVHDREGRLLQFIAPELCGIEPSAAVGRLPRDLYPPSLAEEISSRIEQVVTTGLPVRADFSEIWRGREHQFAEFAEPLFGAGNAIQGVVRYCRNLTILREAEGASRLAAQTLQTLLANLPGMAYRFRLTAGWPLDFASEGTETMTGYPPSHFLGPRAARFQEVVFSEDRERRSQGIERAVGEGRPFRITYRIQTASGQIRWLLDQGRALPGADGEATVVEGFATDITARVNSENALLQSERDYRLLVENQTEFVVKLDGQCRFLFVSPSCCEFLGIAEPDLLKTDFLSLCQEEFQTGILHAFQQLREPPCTARFDHRAATRHGLRWLGWSFKGVLDPEGRVVEAVGVGRDITAQRAISDALSESESRFRTLTETTTAAIFILQGNRVTYSNPGAETLSGRSTQELRQVNFWEELFPAQSDLSPAKIAGLTPGAGPLQAEACLQQKDHTFRWVQLTVAQTLFEGRPAQIVTAFDITARKEAEAATRQSEAKYRQIFEGVSEGIYLSTVGGKPLLVNPALVRMLGFKSQEDLLTRDIATEGYADPEERTRFAELIERDGQVTDFESHWFRKDGSVVTVVLNSHGVRGSDGRIAFYEGTVRDITEERRSQQALQESEASYRALFDHSSDAIFLADPETGMLLDANQRAQELIGRDLEEIRGMYQMDLHPPEERERYQDIFHAHALGKGSQDTSDMVVQHRDGHRVPVDISGSAFRAGGRRVQMGIFHDITDRKRNEAALLRERDFSVSALDSLPAIFYVLDSGGSFLRWNHALEQVGEYSAEEIGHMHPLEFFEGADKALIAERIFQVFSQGQATSEAALVSKSGKRTPYYFSARKIQLDGQDCLIGTGIDISERKRSEEALRESETRLQKILEQSPIAIAIVGADGTIEFINRKFVETFGYAPEEVPTLDHWTRLAYPDPAYRQALLAIWARLLEEAKAENREIEGGEYHVTCKDGSVKICFIFGVPIGEKYISMLQDVTERRRAEAAALEYEARLRAVLARVPIVVYALDREGVFTFSEGQALEGLGLRPAQVVGQSVFQVYAENSEIKDNLRQVLKGESRSWVASVGDRIFDAWATPQLDASGVVSGAFGLAFDATERIRAEVALRESESRLQKILVHSPIAMALVGLDGTIEFINEKAVETFGYLPEDIPHMDNWWKLAYPEEAYRKKVIATWMGLLQTALANNREIDGREYRVTCKDRTVKTVFIFGVPVANKVFVIFQDVTARKAAEAALQESETRYRLVVEQTGRVVYEYLPEDDRFAWSGALETTTGWTAAGLPLQMSEFEALLPPEDLSGLRECFSDARQAEGRFAIEHRLRRQDGHILWVDNKGVYLTGGEGRPPRILGTLSDVTVRHEALEEVLRVTARLRHLLVTSPTVIYASRAESDFPVTFMSENVWDLLHLRPSQFLESSSFWAQRIHPNDTASLTASVTALFETGAAQHRYRFLDGEGNWRWMQDDIRLLKDPTGNPVEAIGSWTDVTDLALAEEEIRRSRERLQVILNRSPMACILWDTEFKVVFWNAAAERIFGFPAREAMGKHPYDFIVPKEVQAHVDLIWGRLLQGDETAHSENENTRADGSRIICEWYNTPLKELDGRITGILSMTQDVTERRRAEEEILRQNRQLSSILASSEAMTGFVELTPTAKALCEATLQAFGLEMVWIGLVVPESTELAVLASAGRDGGYTAGLHVRWDESPRAQGPTGRCIKSRKPELVAVNDPAFTPWRQEAEARNFRMTCAIPLLHEDTVRGALNLYSAEEDAFTPKVLETLQIFARQCTMVIVNAALYEEARRTVQELLDRSTDP